MGKLQSSGPVPSNLAPSGISEGPRLLFAMHKTRRAWAMRSDIVVSICAIAAPSLATVQNFKTRSGAPFRTANMWLRLGWPWIVSIHLFSELKGISKTLSFSSFDLVLRTAPGPPCTCTHARRIATSVGDPVNASAPFSILKFAALFRMPHNATSPSIFSSFIVKTLAPGSRLYTLRPSAGPPGKGTAKSCTVISPLVRVPVLSEQNTETHPRVSTASILRTRTYFLAICSDAIIKEIVTVGNKPSGTCANNAAALFCKTSAAERLMGDMRFATKLKAPTMMATTAMM
mmetsp:Transcript_59674/g.171136  ORF Transcript_59674/g.171136 Transcript_59674/m.171136 type:complete len:288 (+) Transcript_59674:1791-2654(+)